MSKYNFELDLDSENSLSLIIDMIKPNSKILEFGPAHGRLTKYLKENMNCIIDIVEIDEDAGNESKKFANKSFIGSKLGDIENYMWLEALKNDKYDYIVFADVLEHLYWPDKVLKKCKKILKDKGSILLSVPNIAHNSVIIDLINDEFKYNNLGLLDNTHIRFFTYNSLNRMINESGFVSVNERGTYSRVGENEILNSYGDVDKEISKSLRVRDKCNMYQYIFEIKKAEYYISGNVVKSINLDRSCEYELVCYIKDIKNLEYTEEKTARKKIYPGIVHEKIDLSMYKGIQELRLDPITTNCILSDVIIYTMINNTRINLNVKYTNATIVYENQYIFSDEDPQIYVDINNNRIDNLFIEFKVIDYDTKNINYIINIFNLITNKNIRELEKKDNYIKEITNKLEEKDNYIKEITNKLEEKDNYIKEITNKLEEKKIIIRKAEKNILWKIIQNKL